MWLIIILAVFAGVLLCPLKLIASYGPEGGSIYVRYGLIILPLYPGKKKSDSTGEKTRDKKNATTSDNNNEPVAWLDYLALLKRVVEPIRELGQRLRVDRFNLKVILTNDDPCDLSVLYGRIWAAASDLQIRLNQLFKIKKQSLDILCDFVGEHTVIDAYICISITFVRLLSLLLRHGFGIVKEYMAIKNRRKGGTINEQEAS